MIKVRKLGLGFWFLAASLVLTIVAFILYFATSSAFKYMTDRWVVALVLIALWSMVCLTVQSLLSGNKPFWVDILYVIAVFALIIGMIKFLIPCLSPIGIYFTVHNMGDVEANALGVPRCIAAMVFFVLASASFTASAFMRGTKKEGANE